MVGVELLLAQARSKPFEKNLPWAVVIRHDGDIRASERISESRERILVMRSGFKQWSSSPVRVRM